MRKSLFFLFILIFIFTGCDNKIEIKKNFKSGIYVSTEDINFKGNFSRNKKGELFLKVTYPENLKGYTYRVKGDKVNTIYMGIKDNFSMDNFPNTATIKVLYNVFESLEDSNMRKEDNFYILKCGEYKATVNSKGYIENIKGAKTDITFVNQK